MVGKDNSYGLPKDEIVKRLENVEEFMRGIGWTVEEVTFAPKIKRFGAYIIDFFILFVLQWFMQITLHLVDRYSF